MPDTGLAAFARWRELVPPPDPADRLGPPTDWAAVEAELGLPLPADYRAYIEEYGFGWVNRLVAVLHPSTRVPHLNLARNAEEAADPEALEMAETPPPHPIGIGPDRLLPVAQLETQDALYWHTDGADPDRWPIVFRDAEAYRWQQFELSLVGFLLALFAGEIAPADYASAGYLDGEIRFEPNPWKHPIEV